MWMTQLNRNLVANFAGRGWSAFMGIAFIPLLIRFMGIESYGLVGVFVTLQAMFLLLDLGLPTTLNRELAQYAARTEKSQDMRDLVRTLEFVYWGLALCIGLTVMLLSPIIARKWISSDSLSTGVVQQAVMLMGVIIALQWPLGFYAGGLLGLQRQILANVLNAVWFTLRFAGGVAVLWLVSPTVLVFFKWQVIASALSTGLMAAALWRSLPTSRERARFQVPIWKTVWRFAAGMSGISATVLLLTQLDKIILSRMLPLEMFGYYTLAWTVANGLTVITGSVFAVVFPVFSRHAAVEDTEALKQIYHRSCQLLSVLILPIAILVALFSPEILLIWTRNPIAVANTHRLVSLLIIGTALNGLMNPPYALQLAHGWTDLAFRTNLVAAFILLPLLVAATASYGAVGAASIWVLLNGAYVLIQIQIMHRRLLGGEKWRWYVEDVGLPLIAALSVTVTGRLLIESSTPLPRALGGMVVTLLLALAAAGLAAPRIRGWLAGKLRDWRLVQGI